MPYADDDESDDELDERELPDESDFNDDDEEDTATCPHCGAEVYEDAERCPKCGEYPTSSPKWRKPWWLLAAAIVCVLIVLEWVFHDRL